MSLFPAYSDTDTNNVSKTSEYVSEPATVEESWLTNPSFLEIPAPIAIDPITVLNDDSIPSTSEAPHSISSDKSHKKKKHKKEKIKKAHKKEKRKPKQQQPIDVDVDETLYQFTGNEDYYVDKQPARGYNNVDTLHKPACPRYRIHLRQLGTLKYKWKSMTSKRYYDKHKIQRDTYANKSTMTDEEFTLQTKLIKEKLTQQPRDIEQWLIYVEHQNSFPMSATKAQLCERKIDVLKQALQANPGNERLYYEYVRIIDETYPSYEVSKILDGLITKDPTNYVLWNAQILATQGSMARCNIPDVLRLYAKCMNSMYKRNCSDEIMLKLFKSCCLFLRQAGLSEQFFALLKLALDLNVCENKFNKIQPNESEQDVLIEYEEVILKSGLPLNEIWLRIEKLRQNYYFLPCPSDRTCSDPQRIIFNEDIFQYVYPLANREYSFHLAIIILQLLKVPLSGFHGQEDELPEVAIKQELRYSSEFDSIEEILPIFLKSTINKPSHLFDTTLCELIKDFHGGPTYIPTAIGYELYLNCIVEILLLCSESFDSYATNARRHIFLVLWLRLERVLLIISKLLNKWMPDKEKRLRTKIKNLLKRDENRNCMILYSEYGLIEYECGRFDVMETIFMAAIDNRTRDTDDDRSSWWSTYICFIEILMREGRWRDALNALISLALDENLGEQRTANVSTATENVKISADPSNARCLLAVKKLNSRLGDLICIERNVTIMIIEQYILPDYLLNVIKAKIYLLMLWKNAKEDACDQIEYLIKTFVEKSARHIFIRENLYELFVNVLIYLGEAGNAINIIPQKHTYLSGTFVFNVMQRALNEFPNNLHIAKAFVMVESQPWHKICMKITQKYAPKIIPILITGAIYRSKIYTKTPTDNATDTNMFEEYFLTSDSKEIEQIYKLRICNMLRSITSKNSIIRKNSLIWRIYFKYLVDFRKDFNQSRNILLAALDECPWNKPLYLDGTVFVPQELAHIQDLIIEKQLRIYALPEELEILRNYDPE